MLASALHSVDSMNDHRLCSPKTTADKKRHPSHFPCNNRRSWLLIVFSSLIAFSAPVTQSANTYIQFHLLFDCIVARWCFPDAFSVASALGLTGCGLTGCGLTGCGLTGCGLTGCGLTGCGLTGCVLTGCGLTGCGLMGRCLRCGHTERVAVSGSPAAIKPNIYIQMRVDTRTDIDY